MEQTGSRWKESLKTGKYMSLSRTNQKTNHISRHQEVQKPREDLSRLFSYFKTQNGAI
jgi:hypothetical protein